MIAKILKNLDKGDDLSKFEPMARWANLTRLNLAFSIKLSTF